VRIGEFLSIKSKFEKSEDKTVDLDEFSSLFVVLKRVFLFIGLIYFIVLVLAGTFALDKPINSMQDSMNGWIAWSIIVVTTTFTLTHNYYQIYLEGLNQVAKVQMMLAKLGIFSLGIILVVLLISPTLINIVGVYQFVGLLNLFFMMRLARKVENKFISTLPKKRFKFDVFKVVYETAWKSGVTTVLASIVKHISGILVANLMSPSQSAPFLLTKRIFEILDNFTMTTFSAMVPRIASLRGKGDFKVLNPLLKKLFYLAYSVFIFGYLGFILLGDQLLVLIKSNTTFGSIELIIAFSLAHFISRWGGMIGIITNQSNLILEHIAVIFYSFGFFLFVYLFYTSLEELVFPIATIFGVAIASQVTFKRAYKTFNVTFIQFEKDKMFIFLTILTLINLIYYWSNI
jgi:O-antigen/teichoic acid export membrane protein